MCVCVCVCVRDTIDIDVVVYKLSYRYVHMCRHINWCEYM